MVRRERHIDGESGHQSRRDGGPAIKNDTCDTGDTIKLKDVTTKLLALARHLLSFYPGTHAKEVAAAKKGKAALQDSDSDALDESSGYSPPSSTDDD